MSSRSRGELAVSRRAFVVGGVAFAAVLADLPRALALRGWSEQARAAELDLTRDTFNGFVAFIVPGPDAYSVAQGEATEEPGGLAADASAQLIELLDGSMPPVPAASLIAALLNGGALEEDPAARSGGFLSPFSRLSFRGKAGVFRRLESDPVVGTNIAEWVIHTLPALAALLSFSEAGVLDPQTHALKGRPVGWDITSYSGIAEGRNELIGYWKGTGDA